MAPGHQELDALLVFSLGGEVERGLASVRVSGVDVGSQRLVGQENFQNFVQTLFGGKVNRTLARVLDGDVDVGAVLWVLDLEDVVKLFFSLLPTFRTKQAGKVVTNDPRGEHQKEAPHG